MSDFIYQNIAAIQSIISIVLLIAIYFAFKFRIDLWWLNFWYSLPLVGKMASLSRNSSRYAADATWTNSERALCHDYIQFVTLTSKAEFNGRIDYMTKAHDDGRSPTPAWIFIVLGTLVIAESMGFSYLLGTFMAIEGSENTRLLIMVGVVVAICTLMGFLTHFAGRQLYRTNLVRRCQKEWRDDGQHSVLRSKPMTLKDDQNLDNDQPHYTQCVNRVDSKGSYFLVGVVVAAIMGIALVSTVMRFKYMESEQARETVQSVNEHEKIADGNPFAKPNILPNEITVPQAAADAKAKADIRESFDGAGKAAFVMLAVIFVMTQIVGITAGYKWGFAGTNSRAAHKGTLGFALFDDYMRYFRPILANAEAKLSTLQQMLAEKHSNVCPNLKHSFEDFRLEQYLSQAEHAEAMERLAPPQAPQPSPVKAAALLSVDDVVAKIEQYGADREGAKRYLMSISDELRREVMPVLKELKETRLREEAQRSSAFGQELDDVL